MRRPISKCNCGGIGMDHADDCPAKINKYRGMKDELQKHKGMENSDVPFSD